MIILATSNSFAMRCGNKLVQEGDFEYKLVKLCGKPEAIATEGDKKVYIYTKNGRENQIVVRNGRIWEER